MYPLESENPALTDKRNSKKAYCAKVKTEVIPLICPQQSPNCYESLTPMPCYRKQRNRDLPANLYETGNGYYRYKHPQTNKWHGVGKNRQQAISAAHKLNGELIEASAITDRILKPSQPKLATFLKTFNQDIMPKLGLADKTIKEHQIKLPHIADALGQQRINRISVADCAVFLDQYPDTQSNRYRSLLMVIFKHAVAKGLAERNPVNDTMPKKLNVKRKRLSVEQYQAIHDHAPAWLQNAMDLSLLILQRREDLAALHWEQVHDGAIWIQQKKVERHGMGNLKIRITPAMQAILDRCAADDIESSYVIHRKPQRKVQAQGRDDFTMVLPDLITKGFSKARSLTGLFTNYKQGALPTFHEIRSLGAKIYEDNGIDKKIIQGLLGHTSEKMTDTYLGRYELHWDEINI